jgi:hypothetical protein
MTMLIESIETKAQFDTALAAQRDKTFSLLETASTGSDELSALIKSVINKSLLVRIDSASLHPWLVVGSWNEESLRESHTGLTPYSTSMDCKLPGENIILLSKQVVRPGAKTERWMALQAGAKIAYITNDPILACRLNGLQAFFNNRGMGET